jgi:hypothetical protein
MVASAFPEDEDDAGRLSPERAERILRRFVDREDELRWTIELVKIRLEECAVGIERLSGRVGPSQRQTFWPEPSLYGDLSQFDRNARAEGERKGTRAPDRFAHGMSEIAVTRIEEAVAWPARYLADPVHDAPREALKVWLWCSARNESFDHWFKALGCSRATAYRRIDQAAEVILAGVIRDEVTP